MFDDLRFLLIVTEGSHDVGAISRILSIRGFKEIRKKSMVPVELWTTIPKQYPFGEGDELGWVVPKPTFLSNGDQYVIIINAGGIEKIARELSNAFENLNGKALSMLCGIAVVADMDKEKPDERKDDLLSQINEEMENGKTKGDHNKELIIETEEGKYPLSFYFFPDNTSKGTLELLLLNGADVSYPDWIKYAKEYIQKIKTTHTFNNFDDLKAEVGVIANVLKPGKANQVSIHDNEWITEETLRQSDIQAQFADFLDSVIKLMRKE